MWPVERLHTELRIYRLSRTRPRDHIYLELGRHGPIRLADLARIMQGEVGKRSVYRTARAFINAQVARELPGGLVELTFPFVQRKYDILCRGCGRRTTFWDAALERSLEAILKRHRHVLPAHQLELSGLCDLCAQQI